MARSRRIDWAGAWHHVMHRGARREPIFRRDDHCLLFLGCLEEAVEHHGLEVHAYALMPNHYHLLVRSPLGNLSRCMRHLNATYTQRVNLRHGWDGPLFRGRFRSQLVDEDRYLDHLFAYIHLNPIQAGLAKRLDDPSWTSLRAYLGKERSPRWLRTEHFTERFGGRAGLQEAIRARRKGPDAWPDELDPESGWIRPAVPLDDGRRPRSTTRPPAAARASVREVLDEVARVAGCSVAALKERAMGPRANPARRLAVWALSRAHVFSHREIASALRMSEGQVAKVLWRLRSESPPDPLPDWMRTLAGRHVESGRS
jgi:REP element-mobilizing transposase RayT